MRPSIKNIFLPLLLLVPLRGFSQNMQDTVQLKVVEVQDVRQKLFVAGTRVTSFDSATLAENKFATLAEVLPMQSTVFVKSYGTGNIATLSFRGTGASHTTVLWNGFSVNAFSTGLTDLSLMTLSGIDEVKIYHGGTSYLYGSGAIGGSISLNNVSSWKRGTNVFAGNSMGSFGTYNSMTGLTTGTEKIQSKSNFMYRHSQNNFPFRNTALFQAPVQRQANGEILQYNFTQTFFLKLPHRQTLAAGAWWQCNQRKIPPAMTAVNTHALQRDSAFRSFAEWKKNFSKGDVLFRGAFFDEYMRYTDDFTDSKINLKSSRWETETRRTLLHGLLLSAGAGYGFIQARIDAYGEKKCEYRAMAYAALRYDFLKSWVLNAVIRKEWTNGYNAPAVPALGVEGNIFRKIIFLKGAISKTFNYPSMNDRYWIPGGNRSLLPEYGWSREAGLRIVAGSHNHFDTEITAYQSDVNDWIQWQPGSTGIWSAANVKKVQSKGIEFSTKSLIALCNALKTELYTNYAYTASVNKKTNGITVFAENKQLVYVPRHQANATLRILYRTSFVAYTHTYTGYRYITSDNTQSLPHYTLGCLSFGKIFVSGARSIEVRARIDNIWDVAYQAIEWRAMPGRSCNVHVFFNLNETSTTQ